MSLWVRAFCRRSLATLTTDELSHALDDADFAMMAEHQELDESIGYAAESSLRFEEIARNDKRWSVLVHYAHHSHPDDDWWLRLDVWSDPADVSEEANEVLEDEVPAKAREVLQQVVSSAGFDLKLSDCEGMGLPIAYHLAMWLAAPERGDGVVEYEGQWFDPVTYDELA